MTAGAWTFAFVDLAGFTALTEPHGNERPSIFRGGTTLD